MSQTSRLYRSLYLIRRVEEEIARVYPTDCIKSPVHLSIGQEAASVGVCDALRTTDAAFGTYRGHALYLAKGGDLRAMIAELYGKDTGCTRGKGGSMHLIDVDAGVMGTSAVVGTTIPHAVGFAKAIRIKKEDRVVACFFGDGAVEEGAFHESLNFAVLHRLPVLFVCENNFFAIHTHIRDRQGNPDLVARARSYGMPAEHVPDGDTESVRAIASGWIEAMRAGDLGPAFLQVDMYRWREHVGPGEDFDAGFRTRSQAQVWKDRDPVATVGAKLDANERAAIEREVEAAIADAFEFAEQSPFPEATELWTHMDGRFA